MSKNLYKGLSIILSSTVDKYRNKLVTRIICFSFDKNDINIFKRLISIVIERQKEIGGNTHAES